MKVWTCRFSKTFEEHDAKMKVESCHFGVLGIRVAPLVDLFVIFDDLGECCKIVVFDVAVNVYNIDQKGTKGAIGIIGTGFAAAR